MKNVLKIASFALLASLFIISSCSKDEDGPPKNTLRYDGKNYNLAFAFGLNYGSFQEGAVTYNNTDFVLVDRVIDPQENDPVFEHGLYLEMYSAGGENFQEGNFSFYSGSGSIPSGNLFTEATLFFYDDEVESIVIADGTIKLSIDGNNYTFTFDMIDDDGKRLEGNFSGEIEIDNVGEPNISGSISIGDGNKNADFGEIVDYGSTGTHYNYDFYIYDSEETYELYFEAFSLGTGSFQPGIFSFQEIAGSYFNTVKYSDLNTFNDFFAIEGSVEVTKLAGAREYQLDFDVVLDDESTLQGIVEGDFDYYDFGGRMGRVKELDGPNHFNVKKSTLRRTKK